MVRFLDANTACAPGLMRTLPEPPLPLEIEAISAPPLKVMLPAATFTVTLPARVAPAEVVSSIPPVMVRLPGVVTLTVLPVELMADAPPMTKPPSAVLPSVIAPADKIVPPVSVVVPEVLTLIAPVAVVSVPASSTLAALTVNASPPTVEIVPLLEIARLP